MSGKVAQASGEQFLGTDANRLILEGLLQERESHVQGVIGYINQLYPGQVNKVSQEPIGDSDDAPSTCHVLMPFTSIQLFLHRPYIFFQVMIA